MPYQGFQYVHELKEGDKIKLVEASPAVGEGCEVVSIEPVEPPSRVKLTVRYVESACGLRGCTIHRPLLTVWLWRFSLIEPMEPIAAPQQPQEASVY